VNPTPPCKGAEEGSPTAAAEQGLTLNTHPTNPTFSRNFAGTEVDQPSSKIGHPTASLNIMAFADYHKFVLFGDSITEQSYEQTRYMHT
jgi:hypothetical protein